MAQINNCFYTHGWKTCSFWKVVWWQKGAAFIHLQRYLISHNAKSESGLHHSTLEKNFALLIWMNTTEEEKSPFFAAVIENYINSLCLILSDCLKFNNQKCRWRLLFVVINAEQLIKYILKLPRDYFLSSYERNTCYFPVCTETSPNH